MKQHLEALRLSHPGCLLVAFGDAATELVLRASHENTYRREHLDQLCRRAASSFRLMDAAAQVWPCGSGPNETTLVYGQTIAIFVREDPSTPEFLCMVCDTTEGIDRAILDARTTLKMIAADP